MSATSMSVRGAPAAPSDNLRGLAVEARGEGTARSDAPRDPLEDQGSDTDQRPRRRYVLDDTGFDEVPPQYRKFYRKWRGAGDELAANEVLCPVCKVVIRSSRELRPGDRVYCMPCMSRLTVVRNPHGGLEARVVY